MMDAERAKRLSNLDRLGDIASGGRCDQAEDVLRQSSEANNSGKSFHLYMVVN